MNSCNIDDKLFMWVSEFKITNIENLLSKMFESYRGDDAIKYLGNLNKTDIIL